MPVPWYSFHSPLNRWRVCDIHCPLPLLGIAFSSHSPLYRKISRSVSSSGASRSTSHGFLSSFVWLGSTPTWSASGPVVSVPVPLPPRQSPCITAMVASPAPRISIDHEPLPVCGLPSRQIPMKAWPLSFTQRPQLSTGLPELSHVPVRTSSSYCSTS